MNIQDAYADFLLSREAMNVTERTMGYYKFFLSKFIEFLESRDFQDANQITPFSVRLYLKDLRDRDLSDSYIHCYARVIKTFARFLLKEEHISKEISFEMPRIAEKSLRVLSIAEIKQVVDSCDSVRDKLLIMFFVDSGVRLTELSKLNWSDVDLNSGSVMVREGKGRKFRVVGTGIKTRRLLLKYKSEIENSVGDSPLFQTFKGTRLSPMGIRSFVVRLSKKSGIQFSPHSLRRSFAKLSIKAGMNIVYLQSLMGHSHIDTTRAYIQKLDDREILEAHKSHGAVDTFF